MGRQSAYAASIVSRRAELAGPLWDLSKIALLGELPFSHRDRVCSDVHLGERSAGSSLEHLEVPDGVPMVLPLLLEDHMKALQHSVVFARVARAGGRDAVPLQLLRRRAGDHFAHLIHALLAQIEHLAKRGVGVRVDAPPARAGKPRSTQAPRVVRVGDPLHHPPQPAVRGKHEVTVRLHEAPLALDLLVEDRLGQLPSPGDSPSPDVFDHRPGVCQALGIYRPQLVALGPQPDALGIATFHLCRLRSPRETARHEQVIWIADQSEYAATISSRRVRLPGLRWDLGNASLPEQDTSLHAALPRR